MIWCHLIFWSITFDAILGHIYVLDEIYRFSRSCMLVPIREIYAEMMACSLFYDNPSVQPLWSHSARPTIQLMAYWGIFPFQTRFTDLHGVIWSFPLTGCAPRWWLGHYSYDDFSVEPFGSHPIWHALLDTQMTSCFLPRDPSWIYEHDSVIDSDDQDYISVDAWLWCHLIFPTCHTFDAILAHISAFDQGFQIPTYLRDWPQLRDIRQIGDFVSFHHDPPMDFLLSRFIRLTLSDVSVTFWMESSQVRGLSQHHFVGARVRSTMHPYWVTHDSSGQIGYIWCHTGAYFPYLAVEAIVLSHIHYSFHHSAEIYGIRLTDHYSWALHRDELSVEHRSRLVESLLAISSGLRFAATCHTGA